MKSPGGEDSEALKERADQIFTKHMDSLNKQTDRLFSALLLCEWVAGIVIALCTSPMTWTGSDSSPHMHLIAAVFLGGLLALCPLYFTYKKPGHALTRHVIAISQMLFSSLFIHLSGGKIETHFHIFGSLAFLAVYKDWRVLVTASAVVIFDHIVRGIFTPQTIYGVSAIQPERWLEHGWWVIFEDTFLIKACLSNVESTKQLAQRQAQLEVTQGQVEHIVKKRTHELSLSERRLATQYRVSHILADSQLLLDAFPKLIAAIAETLTDESSRKSTIFGEIWGVDTEGKLACSCTVELGSTACYLEHDPSVALCSLAEEVIKTGKCAQRFVDCDADSVNASVDFGGGSSRTATVVSSGVGIVGAGAGAGAGADASAEHLCAFAFPVVAENEIKAVIKFVSKAQTKLKDEELSMFESLGQQIGQFIVRKDAELNNKQLANIVQSSTEAIIGQDTEGRITSWNRGAERIFGYSADEAVSASISIIIPAERLHEFESLKQEFSEFETVRLTKANAQRDVAISNSLILDSQRNVIGSSMILRDITERKESERRVSEFYSTVSHELRTPLTSIRGALGLIEGGIVDSSTNEALDLIKVARESSDRLIRLINNILDLKKIEAGKFELAIETLNPKELVDNVVKSLMGMSETAGITLDSNIRTEKTFTGDKDRCTQVLINLVSNAIKFSPSGSRVSISNELTEAGLMRFAVTDTGLGIAADQQHKLFDKFQQLDSSDTRLKEGTGLGLAISKAIVEQHGGVIGVDSAVGAGSTFWIELPLESTGNINAEDEQRILIIEDDNSLAQILSVHIASQGFEVSRVASLEDARAILRQALPAVIMLDLTSSNSEGLAVLESLRKDFPICSIPLILIGDTEQNPLSLVGPITPEWLRKPVEIEALIQAIERSLALPNKSKDFVLNQ